MSVDYRSFNCAGCPNIASAINTTLFVKSYWFSWIALRKIFIRKQRKEAMFLSGFYL